MKVDKMPGSLTDGTEIQDDETIKTIPPIEPYHPSVTLTQKSLDKKKPFGPSYWKFHSSLLHDPSYVDLITRKYCERVSSFT